MPARIRVVLNHVEVRHLLLERAVRSGIILRRKMVYDAPAAVLKELQLLLRLTVGPPQPDQRDVQASSQPGRPASRSPRLLPPLQPPARCVLGHDPVQVVAVPEPPQRVAVDLAAGDPPQSQARPG